MANDCGIFNKNTIWIENIKNLSIWLLGARNDLIALIDQSSIPGFPVVSVSSLGPPQMAGKSRGY